MQSFVKNQLEKEIALMDDVLLFHFTGSSSTNKFSKYSDLDICVIAREEAFLDKIVVYFIDLLNKLFGVVNYSKPSQYHVYNLLTNGVIVDLNIYPPSVLSLLKHPSTNYSNYVQEVIQKKKYTFELFIKALTSIGRVISKIEKSEIILIQRFIEQLRQVHLFPLLFATVLTDEHPYPFPIEYLESNLQTLILKTYIKPNKEEGKEAVEASLKILESSLNEAASKNFIDEMEIKIIDKKIEEMRLHIKELNGCHLR